MKHKLYVLLISAIAIFLKSSLTQGQQQWLQYRSLRQADRQLGDIGMQTLMLTRAQPKEILLPEGKSDDLLFAYWTSPLAEKGGLWIVLNRSGKFGPYDKLLIDANEDNSLIDETEIECYRRDSYQTYFGPVKVIFKGDDGPITYH